MTTLKSHICKAYKEREEITKDSLDFLCELEKNEINKSDYDYENYNGLIKRLEDKDYEDLLEDNEIKKHIQKITGKKEIKMDFFTKKIIDRTVFDIMILKIKDEERKQDKSKELKPKSENIDEIIEEIKKNPDIISVYLFDKGLTDDDIEKLVKILPKTKIKSLNLMFNKIGDDGAKALAKNENLKYLDLGDNNIGDDGAKALAKNDTLRSLDLGNNNIGDDGAKSLAKNENLKSLDLLSNNIGDDGAKALAENNTLKHLHLWNNDIGDKGAKALAKNDTLRSLDLGWNNITNKDKIKELCKANNIKLEI